MSNANFTQASFLGGEWSPFAQGRIDRPDYPTGMNVCRNGMPIEEGAWVRRGGTKYLGTTRNGLKARLIKFDFEQNAPYQMEFTNAALRFWSVSAQTQNLSGPLPLDFRLVTTNDNQQVSAISAANPAVVQTAAIHNWTTGDQVILLIQNTQANAFATPLTNRQFGIIVTDPTHFSLVDSITGLGINGTNLGWIWGSGGTVVVARAKIITTPYIAADLPLLRHVQAETESILLHNKYAPEVLTVTTLPTASSFAVFSLASATFVDGPYLDPPTDGSTLTPSALTGTITLTASSILSINGGLGFQSTDVGRHVRLFSQPAAWVSGTTYTAGQAVTYNGAYFSALAGSTGASPDISLQQWQLNPNAALWAWAIIATVADAHHVTAALQSSPVNPVLLYTTAISDWRLGTFSTTTGWPSCGCYYEGRLWLSGAVANRVDGSSSNNLFTFSPTAADGTVGDNNAIDYTFNSEGVNPIFWMIGTNSGIVCGTQPGEWLVHASQQGFPLTPTSAQAHQTTTYGCANVEPERTELTISFVHRYSRKILEYFPDVFSARYTAPNLNHNSKHLTLTGIKEIRYQQELLPVIWARCGDGSLFGMTYKRSSLFSSQGPEFVGAHRHDLGSTRVVESISVGPSIDGTLDTLAMVTNDDSGVRHVEVMTDFFDVDDDIKSAWQCDDAVTPTGGLYATGASGSSITFYGLWHLNGQTVTCWCGGVDAGDYLVTNGAITVPIDVQPGIDLFTTDYLKSISKANSYGNMGCPIWNAAQRLWTVPCIVGFTFTSQGQTLRPDTQQESRSPTGPGPGKKRKEQKFAALLAGTQGIRFGTTFDNMSTAPMTSYPGRTRKLSLNQLFSGVTWASVSDSDTFDGMLCWQIDRPYPAAVVQLTGFMTMAGE